MFRSTVFSSPAQRAACTFSRTTSRPAGSEMLASQMTGLVVPGSILENNREGNRSIHAGLQGMILNVFKRGGGDGKGTIDAAIIEPVHTPGREGGFGQFAVDPDCEMVDRVWNQSLSDGQAEWCKSTFMCSHGLAIQKHVTLIIYTLEIQTDPLIQDFGPDIQFLEEPGDSIIVVIVRKDFIPTGWQMNIVTIRRFIFSPT